MAPATGWWAVLSGHPELQRLLQRRDILERDESEQATAELPRGSKGLDGPPIV